MGGHLYVRCMGAAAVALHCSMFSMYYSPEILICKLPLLTEKLDCDVVMKSPLGPGSWDHVEILLK